MSDGNKGCGCVLITLVIHVSLGIIMLFWSDSNFDYLLSLLNNSPVDLPLWVSLIISIIFGSALLPFNIIIWIIRFFV